MPTVQVSARSNVEQVMAVVKQMSPAELRDFMQQLASWQERNGGHGDEEATLIQNTQARLPVADERRLKRLIAKSERGMLTPKELEVYRSLAQKAERISVKRVEALAELVKRRGRPMRVIMREIGGESGDEAISGHPARRTSSGP